MGVLLQALAQATPTLSTFAQVYVEGDSWMTPSWMFVAAPKVLSCPRMRSGEGEERW